MKTILVTGGNRGIGLEICKQLDELGHKVILCSRELEKGKKAAAQFSDNVFVKQLDVTHEESIINLYESVKVEFGKLDVLINNAGVGTRHTDSENTSIAGVKDFMRTNFNGPWKKLKKLSPLIKKAGVSTTGYGTKDISLMSVRYLMEINFYGPWRMMQVFIPLIQKSKNGRIINISSGMGELQSLKGDYPAYRMSKSSLNALTIMFSNELETKGVSVNAMCPGWVKTDMGGPDAPRHVSEGADTAVWLATEENIPSGKFFRDRKVINW